MIPLNAYHSDDSADALERARFAAVAEVQLDAIRQDPDDWARYTADADLATRDGIA